MTTTILNNTKGLEFKEESRFGFPAFLVILRDAKRIGRSYFNMRGYNQDFSLTNAEGVGAQLGERGKATQIRELKTFIKRGFNQLTPYE